ncbi:MAG: hypothetical protein WKF84_07635 [Pyrinomonadaceae bacterium]
MITDDANVDAALANKTYEVRVDGAGDVNSGDVRIDLQDKQSKRIEFAMRDAATGLDVVKSFVLSADRYSADLEVKALRNGEAIPQVKLAVGPSIGDQSVSTYTFYSVAPEAVLNVNQSPVRHHALTIHNDEKSRDVLAVRGNVDWVGLGDTYFAMVAVPAKPVGSS